MGITIRDVAREAGVSTATVSRALRGLPHVDPQTREHVARVAAELDYVASANASRLASGRQGTVAVITPSLSRWFFATVLSGISEVLQAQDLDLLVHSIGDAPSPSLPGERRLRGRVDGVIAVALPTPDARRLGSIGVPLSVIGATVPAVASVTIDDVEAARTATAHLISLGHERIGLIGSGDVATDSAGTWRMAGFRAAMEEAGIPVDARLQADGGFTVDGGETAMAALLARPERPTAVFALSDEMAFGAMRSLRRHGLRPGQDVALIGIDDHDLSGLLDLSTVAQPVADMGRIAAEQVLGQWRGDVPGPVRVPTTLMARGSTLPAPDPVALG